MQNKYYTPELEEFHFGFEYEYKDGNHWRTCIADEITYQQTDFGNRSEIYHMYPERNPFFIGLSNDINSPYNRFRVKYLDKEDIESLGFVKDRIGSGFNKDGCTIWLYDNNYIGITPTEIHGEQPYFRGTIKNKSELKKLLKQLSIT
jgi:hypothetical protein